MPTWLFAAFAYFGMFVAGCFALAVTALWAVGIATLVHKRRNGQ